MDEITIFDLGIFTITIIALCLSVYNTWKQHYKSGTKIYLKKTKTKNTCISLMKNCERRQCAILRHGKVI